MNRPTISEVQESLKSVEETSRERIFKHGLTAVACAVVAIFVVQCTDRFWNESDFVKAVAACDMVPTVRLDQPGPDATAVLSGTELAIETIRSKNECVKDVLAFYERTATMRPVITINKDDVVR
ncbi:hypothetical protein G6L37_05070 [Agrobacterium rubi]|nr:hypothetical protein [Agrobacterium rubi]NTF24727.1 hypothetical protein [Agrobacterium rubi]